MLLTDYIQNLRDTLRDPNGAFYDTATLTRFINRARHQVARDAQCVRYMPPSTASLASVAVSSGGSGYTSASATISDPDASGSYTAATVSVTVGGGQVTAITVLTGGTGYIATPTVTITGNGTGAAGVATITPRVATVANQEVYQYATFQTVAQALVPGLGGILNISGLSVSWGAQKPTLDYLDFGRFQAYLRSYSAATQGPPAVWARYGQGTTGSLYIFPRPSQINQMDVDAFWDVLDLVGTTYPDLIPLPWEEAVNACATKFAYNFAQRADDARVWQGEYDAALLKARGSVEPSVIPSYYGGV